MQQNVYPNLEFFKHVKCFVKYRIWIYILVAPEFIVLFTFGHSGQIQNFAWSQIDRPDDRPLNAHPMPTQCPPNAHSMTTHRPLTSHRRDCSRGGGNDLHNLDYLLPRESLRPQSRRWEGSSACPRFFPFLFAL